MKKRIALVVVAICKCGLAFAQEAETQKSSIGKSLTSDLSIDSRESMAESALGFLSFIDSEIQKNIAEGKRELPGPKVGERVMAGSLGSVGCAAGIGTAYVGSKAFGDPKAAGGSDALGLTTVGAGALFMAMGGLGLASSAGLVNLNERERKIEADVKAWQAISIEEISENKNILGDLRNDILAEHSIESLVKKYVKKDSIKMQLLEILKKDKEETLKDLPLAAQNKVDLDADVAYQNSLVYRLAIFYTDRYSKISAEDNALKGIHFELEQKAKYFKDLAIQNIKDKSNGGGSEASQPDAKNKESSNAGTSENFHLVEQPVK